jgi:hypothetical protein
MRSNVRHILLGKQFFGQPQRRQHGLERGFLLVLPGPDSKAIGSRNFRLAYWESHILTI